MLTCGFVRMNWLFAMVDQSSLDVRHFGLRTALAKRGAPEPRMMQPPFPGVLLRLGKGQIRVSTPLGTGTHTGATGSGSCGPSADMRVTVGQNADRLDLISARLPTWLTR